MHKPTDFKRDVVTRSGLPLVLEGVTWSIPARTGLRWINFSDLKFSDEITLSAMEYTAWILARRSGHSAGNLFSALLKYSTRCRADGNDPTDIRSLDSFRVHEHGTGSQSYIRLVRDWYLWAVRQYTWPSFSEDVALSIERWSLAFEEPYLAIRQGEPNKGPLHPLEDELLKRSFGDDRLDQEVMYNLTGRQIRTLGALLRTTGIRPFQAILLNKGDFRVWERDGHSVAALSIPRAKNGQPPRSEFRTVRLTQAAQELLKEAIRDIPDTGLDDPPLFCRQTPCAKHIALGWTEDGWRAKTADAALRAWVRKLDLRSPINGRSLWVSPKRIRYTYATNLAPKVSPAELAAALDHKDTRSIAHYFTYAPDFFDRLATIDGAKKWGTLAKAFLGIVDPTLDAPGGSILGPPGFADELIDVVGIGRCGSDQLCRLYPPLSCYLCPRFRPDPDADHQGVLAALIDWRQKRPVSVNRARDPLQDQLDSVIQAVGHLLAILPVFRWLRERRRLDLPVPTAAELRDALGESAPQIESEPALLAYVRSWPVQTTAQRRIASRRRQK